MSWARGVDENGREVGYAVEAECDEPGCGKQIDRGLAYRCGGAYGLQHDYGCGGFFCYEHLYAGEHEFICMKCRVAEAKGGE